MSSTVRRYSGLFPLGFAVLLGACTAVPPAGSGASGNTEDSASSAADDSGPPRPSGTAPPVPVPPNFDGVTCAEQNPVPSQGRLLTRLQYDLTIRDLFSGLVEGSFIGAFPVENQVLGFGTNAEYHRASSWLAEGHMNAAEAIGELAIAKLDRLLPCAVEAADAECASGFIRDWGAKAFRRPLTEAEAQPLVALFTQASQSQGFAHGIELVLRAVLQSPQFLYRFDYDRSVPLANPTETSTGYQVDSYEMASRMSYFLWNTMPDAELFDAAGQGALQSAEQVQSQARRMLSDARAKDGALDFFRQWLALQNFGSLVRAYPDATPAPFVNDWRASLELFLQQTLWGQLPKAANPAAASTGADGSPPRAMGTLDDLFTSTVSYLNPALAGLYGATLPEGAGALDFYPVELDVGQRTGLLTQPGLMALIAHPDQTAPIQRGVFVRDQLLCQPPPPPPPTVNVVPPEPDPTLTTRQRFAVHTEASTCSGCHAMIDPLGLPFEDFDNLGRYRDQENGLPMDLSGDVVGVREAAIQGPFNGPQELAQRLANSTQVRQCVATQWYRYGAGRVEQTEDLCSLGQAITAFESSGDNFEDLLVALVSSDSFRFRSEPAAPAADSEVAAP